MQGSHRAWFGLDRIATVMFIVACSAATVWIVRDLGTNKTTRVTATSRIPPNTGRPPSRPPAPIPVEPISIAGATVKGNAQAKVALVIYSDFECPFCGRFAQDTWPKLDAKYVASGRVEVAFRHLPLEAIHASALGAAEAAECAGQQGQFWPMHDLLFSNQKRLAPADLKGYASQLRLKTGPFLACLNPTTEAKVRTEASTGAAIGVTGTPAFLIGIIQKDGRLKVSERFAGARPIAEFESALDKTLARVSATK